MLLLEKIKLTFKFLVLKKIVPLLILFITSNFIFAQNSVDFSVSATFGCDPLTVDFTDNSTGNIVSWFWDFGNGETSTLQNPSTTYTGKGRFTVSLTVTDDNGSEMTEIKTDLITLQSAYFTLNPPNGCAVPHTVFFTDQSILPDTWFWDFGDGNTSTAQNPIHTYTSIGDFTVTLTTRDTIFGCTSIETNAVSVRIMDAEFSGTPSFGCGPLTVNFTDESTGGATGWLWDFGDGNISTAQNPSHVYDIPGAYTVSLLASASNGCTDIQTRDNYVQVIGPDVSFSADTLMGTEELMVNFTDETSFVAPITSWSWDFGDGNTSSSQNPTHLYTGPGSYDVGLTVTDIDGCSRTFVRPAYINIEAAAPIPTMGTWGLIILGMLLSIFAVGVLRNSNVNLTFVDQ